MVSVKISEIFESIQGEGTNAGKEAIFLRTAECNLRCTWCDTKYTWDWKNYSYDKEVKEITINDIKQILEKSSIRHLVITGGEPLMQQDDLVELVTFLKPEFYVEVETNGTILPNNELTTLVDQWNVSPRLRILGIQKNYVKTMIVMYFFLDRKIVTLSML